MSALHSCSLGESNQQTVNSKQPAIKKMGFASKQ
jgi:hypothetical protein